MRGAAGTSASLLYEQLPREVHEHILYSGKSEPPNSIELWLIPTLLTQTLAITIHANARRHLAASRKPRFFDRHISTELAATRYCAVPSGSISPVCSTCCSTCSLGIGSTMSSGSSGSSSYSRLQGHEIRNMLSFLMPTPLLLKSESQLAIKAMQPLWMRKT